MASTVATISPGMAAEFSRSKTYKAGEYILHNNKYWKCKDGVSSGDSWDASDWEPDAAPVETVRTTKAEAQNFAAPYGVDPDDPTKSKTKYSANECCTVDGVVWKSLYDSNEHSPTEEELPVPGDPTTTAKLWKKDRLDRPENAFLVDADTGVMSLIDATTGEVKWSELTLIPYDMLDREKTDKAVSLVPHAINHVGLDDHNTVYVNLPGSVIDNGEEGTDKRITKVRDLIIDAESTFDPDKASTTFATSTYYAAGSYVKYNNKYYVCNANHTSGAAFAADLFDEITCHQIEINGKDGIDFHLYTTEDEDVESAEELLKVPFGGRLYIMLTEIYPEYIEDSGDASSSDPTGIPCYLVGARKLKKIVSKTDSSSS